ncbi:MAG: hypothetical protein JSS91_07695 [Bacteroidetes bacterium]|nr:hypothetical protein [Bacteroidota bacterium]
MPHLRKNVFINCPFDIEYRPILNSILFTLIYIGAMPILSETISSSDIRIIKIKKLIAEADFSIHDISRCRIKKISELPRFNMPFELGLDIGSIYYGNKRQKQKRILILEKDKYFYQKILSDISGQDIFNHNDKPIKVIEIIRDWFSVLNKKKYDSLEKIWNYYNDFNDSLIISLQKEGCKKNRILKLPVTEFIGYAGKYIKEIMKTKVI